MNIATKVLAIYMVSLGGFFSSVAESHAATRAATSCSLSDVEAAITSASVNDIITVPAGNCTWSDTLLINNKVINLVGAGIGNTVINGNNRGANNFLIVYAPTATNQLFRLSGFTFNITEQAGVKLQSTPEPTTQTNIRIHHNRFTNSTVARAAIQNRGVFGVIDNNTFDNVRYPLGLGESATTLGNEAWAAYSDTFHGTAENIYMEDNTIEASSGVIVDCGQGGRYAFRYNTLSPSTASYPLFDQHEWGPTPYACMGAEIYGNQVTGGFGGFLISNQNAGRVITHHNLAPGISVRRLYSDGDGGCSPAYPTRQPLNNSYFFQDRQSATGTLLNTQILSNVCGNVVESSAFWDDSPAFTFTGASGMGSGTLAARPATCTTGVGYWATTQSVTDLTGMTGPNPSTPITGTLYKCTATNTWTAWYTPYTYPHPLRSLSFVDNPPGPPPAPQNLQVTN